MTTATETTYRVAERFNDESNGNYYVVLDQDGDEVDEFESRRDADVEASERNVNAAIEDVIGGIETHLSDLTESRRLSTLKALQAILATVEGLVEEED